MSWFNTSLNYPKDRGHASTAEILECFLQEKPFLSRLALLITADPGIADQCVVSACEMTVRGHTPFRDWLLEWAKTATITNAISKCAEAIRDCEVSYERQGRFYIDHTPQIDPGERTARLDLLLQADALKVIDELDALTRAVLVLRLAIGSSIQDCVLRLNVGRAAVLAANCRGLKWIRDLEPASVTQPNSVGGDRTLQSNQMF